MSSGLANYGRIRFDDLQWERRRYSPNFTYAQSKLADLMLTQHLAGIAAQRGWNLISTAAHPGFTRTNLQTAGASLGRDKPKRTPYNSLRMLPSQEVGLGTEPLLYAATSPDAVSGGYYGPGGRFGLVGHTHHCPPTPQSPRCCHRRPALGRIRASHRRRPVHRGRPTLNTSWHRPSCWQSCVMRLLRAMPRCAG